MYSEIIAHVNQHISLTQDETDFFTRVLQQKTVAKGEMLIQPEQIITQEYFVIKGCLKGYYLDDSGKKHIIQFAVENWWIGDFEAFYKKTPSKLYVEAIEDATLLTINFDDLQKVFSTIPKFERYFRILITNGLISMRQRVLSSLEKNTKTRYIEFCDTYPTLEKRIANYDIANYLGVSPESLSRIRARSIKTT